MVLGEKNTELDEENFNERINRIDEFLKQTEGVNRFVEKILIKTF